MDKVILKVPAGINYISDWKDYQFPKGQCIVNKGVTGCGYTEMCLTNSKNVVLCSPRKMLLENKRDQHVKDLNILYLENKYTFTPNSSEESYFEFISDFENRILQHIVYCAGKGLPVKFMITYDSSKYLIDYLSRLNSLGNYYFIADEQQSIFTDSFLKAEVENDFLENIVRCPNVIYLSATPMLDSYLEQMDEFKNLPYYQLDWSESGAIENIVIKRKRVRSLGEQLYKIIDDYKKQKFPIYIDSKGNIIKSNEAVFYVNSIGQIISAILCRGLKPEDVNILCSNTDENRLKIRQKLGKDFKVGKIPLRGEQHKMFTFCTSTVYVGADFYSPCASTFVFADPNLSCLALDISLDLPQIMGRQRLKENPFKNVVSIFYKTTYGENFEDRAQFDKVQEERRENTKAILALFQKGSDDEKKLFIERLRVFSLIKKYSSDFVSISRTSKTPVYNRLIELAYERAWEVAQKDYQDSISVAIALSNIGTVSINDVVDYKDKDDQALDDFMIKFTSTNIFLNRMKLYCEFMDENIDNDYLVDSLNYRIGEMKYRNYYNLFGTEGCRSVGYVEGRLISMIEDIMKKDSLRAAIIKKFPVKSRFSRKYVKDALGKIYDEFGISVTPKATDLGEYLELREIKVQESGKRVNGFEVIAIK